MALRILIDASVLVSAAFGGTPVQKDNVYLWTCQAGSADVLLTGDEDLLSVSAEALQTLGISDLKIIKPGEFLSSYYK
jgi:predicted nucleic acid-binding protein